MHAAPEQKVLIVADTDVRDISCLLGKFELELVVKDDAAAITGSYWGEPEAGIVGKTIYARTDTPVHSLLHEACHVVCMTEARRAALDRDAGGDDLEESAVCYLQVVLADCLPGCTSARLMRDMDAWGYSFRLGSTEAWFRRDAEDARKFLINHGLLTTQGAPTFRLRA
ncbi:MAG: hypothetical protein WBN07_06100 [Woeseiaceae bacterium]